MTAHHELAGSLAKSYLTAMNVLGDSRQAEAVVMEAVQSLSGLDVTGKALRNAVIERLVQVQLQQTQTGFLKDAA